MGVAGLWNVIRPAGKTRSLTELSVTEGFEKNPDGVRGFRVGIDASIWFFHAEYGKEGENPVLRTLFFRCATLMHSPFLPLFVFDGPKRPDWKRGKKINKTSHKLIPGMKEIVESFGFEWRTAPGEAEAELAYLNRIGVIDGSFESTPSNNLSGNRSNPVLNAAGKDDKNHTKVYRMSEITAHPDVGLTRGGMILIGLMSGGDYHQGGLTGCGPVTASGLAKCGFGDTLFQAAQSMDREQLKIFLMAWRHELCHELRTNSQGHIGRKQPTLAKSVTAEFPDIDILLSYTNPITSESMGRPHDALKLTWLKEPDLGKLAATCELYFEWGYKEAIIKRFRTVIWHSAVLRILRRAVLDLDAKLVTERLIPTTPRKAGKHAGDVIGTPSKMITKHFSTLKLDNTLDDDDDDERLILKIHSERRHVSTDEILEYRLEIAPAQLVRLAESGIKGLRNAEGPDEWAEEDDEENGKGAKKPPPIPESTMRIWMPACMVRLVEPRLLEEFEAVQEAKQAKKARKGKSKAKASVDHGSNSEEENVPAVKAKTKASSQSTTANKPGRKIDYVKQSQVRDLTNKNRSMISFTREPDLEDRFFALGEMSTAAKAKSSIPASLLSTLSANSSTKPAATTSSATLLEEIPSSQVPPLNNVRRDISTMSNTASLSKYSVVRDLTKKKLKTTESRTIPSLRTSSNIQGASKNKPFVDVSSDEGCVSSLKKPNTLAAWNPAPSKTYVAVSDSEDDAIRTGPRVGGSDSFMYDSDDPFKVSSLPSKAKQIRKKHGSSSGSDLDIPTNQLHKSPRKSKEQRSPRRQKESTNIHSMCASPPAKVLGKVREPLQGRVVEVSDTDDELPPAPRFQEPPLLRARARAGIKASGDLKQTSLDVFARRQEKQKPPIANDIIDLT
ncbi:hypothetical protein H0H93_001713 [Arthromyces matolae]|nr:hypothetical protein H0H93_001713 [Arthromyces matolae]